MIEFIILAVVVNRSIGGKELADQFTGFLKAVLPFLHGREHPTISFVFTLEPASTKR